MRQPASPAGRLEGFTSSLRRKLKREEPAGTWKSPVEWVARGRQGETEGVELWQGREQRTWNIPNGELQFSKDWCGGGRGQGHMHTIHTH